mgnify:CR=1 FL=1
MTKRGKEILRVSIGAALFVAAVIIVALATPALDSLQATLPYPLLSLVIFLVPYLVLGWPVLKKAARNIAAGHVFDENFLMSVATIGAFALVLFPDSDPHMAEGAAVMLFYQVGELFQSYAVGKSRKSIADMMDIAPDFANVERDGQLVQVDPYEVAVGDEIVVKAGERVPLDGVEVPASGDFSAQVRNRLFVEQVEAFVSPLDPRVQAVFRLHLFAEKSFPEIAETLGQSESAVKSQYYRLVKRLREEFGAHE